jgi:Ca2+-dependent lipid-binding protein
VATNEQQQSSQSTQPKPSQQPKSAVSKSVKAALVNPITKYAQDAPDKPPYNFEFIIPHPTGVSALDIDIIKVSFTSSSLVLSFIYFFLSSFCASFFLILSFSFSFSFLVNSTIYRSEWKRFSSNNRTTRTTKSTI